MCSFCCTGILYVDRLTKCYSPVCRIYAKTYQPQNGGGLKHQTTDLYIEMFLKDGK